MNERGASDLIVVLSFGSVMIGWVILGGMFSPNDGVSGYRHGLCLAKTRISRFNRTSRAWRSGYAGR
jgi:hypothetical protein